MQEEEEEEQKEEEETTKLNIGKDTSLHYHFCEPFKISALIMANIHGYLSGVENVCKLEPHDTAANDDLYYALHMDFFQR